MEMNGIGINGKWMIFGWRRKIFFVSKNFEEARENGWTHCFYVLALRIDQ